MLSTPGRRRAQPCPTQPLVESGGARPFQRSAFGLQPPLQCPTHRVTLPLVNLAPQNPISLQPADNAEEVTATTLHLSPARTLAPALRKDKGAYYSSKPNRYHQHNHTFHCSIMLIQSFTSRFLVFHFAACLSLVQSKFRTCFHPLPSSNSAAKSMKLSFAVKC